MHVWTLLQHTMIVFYVLRRTTVHKLKEYVTPVLLSSVLFVNKVLTLLSCNNGSEKGTGVNKKKTHVTPFCKYGLKEKFSRSPLLRTPAITDTKSRSRGCPL